MNRQIILFSIVVLLVIAAAIVCCKQKKEPAKEIDFRDKVTIQNFRISSVDIPEDITFAGEKVPVDLFYVRESLDKELTVNTYWHSSTLLLMKRSSRFFPFIEPILKANGIPDDFKYISLIESGLENVTSPAGAVVFWQFLKWTAKEYGLEVNKEVDERYHLEKATEAACRYFNKVYSDYQDWTLVAAAYNAGKRGINRQIDRQKQENYYDLLLNDETERYIFRVLAMKTIFENPEKYGFHLKEGDLYPPIPTRNVTVDSAVSNWADFANHFNINYRLLKEFNPWLRQPYLKNRGKKTYYVKIPEKEFLNY